MVGVCRRWCIIVALALILPLAWTYRDRGLWPVWCCLLVGSPLAAGAVVRFSSRFKAGKKLAGLGAEPKAKGAVARAACLAAAGSLAAALIYYLTPDSTTWLWAAGAVFFALALDALSHHRIRRRFTEKGLLGEGGLIRWEWIGSCRLHRLGVLEIRAKRRFFHGSVVWEIPKGKQELVHKVLADWLPAEARRKSRALSGPHPPSVKSS